MNRSEIIELLCNIILDDPNQKQIADGILASLIRNRISVEEAVEQYNALMQSKQGYWVGKLKSKVVYEALKKYQKGEQLLLDTSKMISSLITHAIIELQSNTQVTKSDLGIPELLDLLNMSLSDQLPEEFYSRLNEVLRNYGYLDEKEGE